MERLVAVDWGTTSLRGALLDARGAQLDARSLARGILTVEPGEFGHVFDATFGDWMRVPGTVCLMAGMVGSRQGWQETEYCPCPGSLADLAQRISWLEPRRIGIVPGMRCSHTLANAAGATDGIPDVMRGEETQVLGALRLLGMSDATVVLPGTHSKWVQARGGRIVSFTTCMTGEFFSLLSQHSILARMLEPETPGVTTFDGNAFDTGVRLAAQGRGLLHNAFSVRTLALFDLLARAALRDYLSGLVIGEEIRMHAPGGAEMPLVLVGNEALTARYQRALESQGLSCTRVGEDACWSGLFDLARSMRLSTCEGEG